MSSREIRIATRKSALALWQAEYVKARLEAAHPGLLVTLVPMVSRGDKLLDSPLSKIGGKGLFVKELDQYGDNLPPKEELPRLAQLIWKIRPLAMTAIESEVSRALQKSASKFVNDRIVGLIDKMAEEMPNTLGQQAESWVPPSESTESQDKDKKS